MNVYYWTRIILLSYELQAAIIQFIYALSSCLSSMRNTNILKAYCHFVSHDKQLKHYLTLNSLLVISFSIFRHSYHFVVVFCWHTTFEYDFQNSFLFTIIVFSLFAIAKQSMFNPMFNPINAGLFWGSEKLVGTYFGVWPKSEILFNFAGNHFS